MCITGESTGPAGRPHRTRNSRGMQPVRTPPADALAGSAHGLTTAPPAPYWSNGEPNRNAINAAATSHAATTSRVFTLESSMPIDIASFASHCSQDSYHYDRNDYVGCYSGDRRRKSICTTASQTLRDLLHFCVLFRCLSILHGYKDSQGIDLALCNPARRKCDIFTKCGGRWGVLSRPRLSPYGERLPAWQSAQCARRFFAGTGTL